MADTDKLLSRILDTVVEGNRGVKSLGDILRAEFRGVSDEVEAIGSDTGSIVDETRRKRFADLENERETKRFWKAMLDALKDLKEGTVGAINDAGAGFGVSAALLAAGAGLGAGAATGAAARGGWLARNLRLNQMWILTQFDKFRVWFRGWRIGMALNLSIMLESFKARFIYPVIERFQNITRWMRRNVFNRIRLQWRRFTSWTNNKIITPLKNSWAWLKGKWNAFYNPIKNFFMKTRTGGIFSGLSNLWTRISGLFKSGGPLGKVFTAFKAFGKKIPVIGQIILAIIGGFDSIKRFVEGDFAGGIKGLASTILSVITLGLLDYEHMMQTWDEMGGRIEEIWEDYFTGEGGILALFDTIGGTLQEVMGGFGDAIVGSLAKFIGTIGGLFGAEDFEADMYDWANNLNLAEALNDASDAIGWFFGEILYFFTDTIPAAFWAATYSIIDWASVDLPFYFKKLWGSIKWGFGQMLDGLFGLVNWVNNKLSWVGLDFLDSPLKRAGAMSHEEIQQSISREWDRQLLENARSRFAEGYSDQLMAMREAGELERLSHREMTKSDAQLYRSFAGMMQSKGATFDTTTGILTMGSSLEAFREEIEALGSTVKEMKEISEGLIRQPTVNLNQHSPVSVSSVSVEKSGNLPASPATVGSHAGGGNVVH